MLMIDPFGGQGVADTIQYGQVIRLTHLETLRNSHSRNAQRPLSVQQEVSAYGDDGVENNGYDWIVACNGSKYVANDPPWSAVKTSIRVISGDPPPHSNSDNRMLFPIVKNHLEFFGRNTMLQEFSKMESSSILQTIHVSTTRSNNPNHPPFLQSVK
jgi:hypothetical protein